MRLIALHAAFFVTGAAALVYEVLWMRRCTVLLGATAPATAATLSALFLGLALGSALFGSVAARARRPLRLLAWHEAGVGATALGVEPLLAAMEPLLAQSAATASSGSFTLAARMAAAMVGILPPAILMGGTLPALAQALEGSRSPGVTVSDRQTNRRHLGVTGGGLYAANTLGAALGAIVTPTILLPMFGSTGALWVAVGASVGIASIALGLDATSRPCESRALDHTPVRADDSPSGPRGVAPAPGRADESSSRARQGAPGSATVLPWSLLLAAAFFSGGVTLGLEVLGTRMLALVHENSIYSFATVLAVFLVGLGVGAGEVRRLLSRGLSPAIIAGTGWLGAGASVVAMPALFNTMTSGLRYAGGTEGLMRHEIAIAVLALATMLPAAILAGSVLPALMEMCGEMGGRTRSTGSALGALLCANTLGAIAGPIVAIFLVGPAVGLWWGIVLFGLAMFAAGEATLSGWLRVRLPLRIAWYAAGAVGVLLLQPGDLPRVRIAPDEKVVSLREGPFGTVAVVERGGHRRLMLNNYYVLGGTASTGEERLAGHLPLLLHADPQRVAFLGLGTGITASAALFHPVREVVAMELVDEVVESAREDFHEANLGVLEDPRVRAEVEDARTGLRRSTGRFDVIVSDLVVPWRRGEAALYTKESFQSARDALDDGGIFCQWVPLFQLSREAFLSIAATFLDVFPETLLFKGDFHAGEPAVALIGLTSDRPLDPRVVEQRARQYALAPDPANPYLFDPAGPWVYLAGPLASQDPELRAAPRNTDRHPIVELSSPMAQFAGTGEAALFTGEPLKRYFDALLARPLAGTPLSELDAEHLSFRQAGHDIWTASLLELQGKRAEADALGLAGLAKLPEPLRRVLILLPEYAKCTTRSFQDPNEESLPAVLRCGC